MDALLCEVHYCGDATNNVVAYRHAMCLVKVLLTNNIDRKPVEFESIRTQKYLDMDAADVANSRGR